MKTKSAGAAFNHLRWIVVPLFLIFASLPALGPASAAAADESMNSPDEAAMKQVVAEFSNGWNTHDAHAMCASIAEDVEWVNWRGEPLGTRKDVEEEHAKLFADLYKNTQRTDTVKSIRHISADLAVVDDYWTMTGARKRDGSEWPYRAGLYTFLMAKRGGRWIITVSHAADFNATAPAGK